MNNHLREYNAEITVCLNYLDVRKQLGNRCLPFKEFKGKKNLGLTYLKSQNRVGRGKNARRKVRLTFLMLKCNKQCSRVACGALMPKVMCI